MAEAAGEAGINQTSRDGALRSTYAIAAQQHLLERAARIRVHLGRDHLRRRVIGVARDAFGNDLPFRTVARHTIRLRRHEHVGCLAADQRSMALIAIQLLVRDRIDLMFRVIELRLRHPAIDQNRFGDGGRAVGTVFHFMAVRRSPRNSPASLRVRLRCGL